MKLPSMAAVISSLLLATAPSFAFTAQNGLAVRPETAGTFNVPWQGKAGPSAFWCAAGDYGIRALHLTPDTRIYRTSEPPRRSGERVRFILDPAGAASSTGLAVFWPKGAGITAGFAQSFCEEDFKRR